MSICDRSIIVSAADCCAGPVLQDDLVISAGQAPDEIVAIERPCHLQGGGPRPEPQDVHAASIGNDRARSLAKAKKIDITSHASVGRIPSAAAIKRVLAGSAVKMALPSISDQDFGGARANAIDGIGAEATVEGIIAGVAGEVVVAIAVYNVLDQGSLRSLQSHDRAGSDLLQNHTHT